MTVIEIAGLLATVGGTVATVYLMYRNNRIFEQQNEIMIAQAEGKTGSLNTGALRRPIRWPLLAMAGMIILVWGAVAVNYFYVSRPFDPNKAWSDNAQLTRISNQTFRNQSVPLDGYEYVNSTFDNVTFTYEGTSRVSIINARFIAHGEPHFQLFSKNKVVNAALSLNLMFAGMTGCGSITRTDIGTGSVTP